MPRQRTNSQRNNRTAAIRASEFNSRSAAVKAAQYNRNCYWKTYRDLQTKANRAWEKFHDDVRRNADPSILLQDQNRLLLLLGECDYMARECMRIASNSRTTSR